MGRGAGRLSVLPSPSALPPVCILAGGLGTRLGERVRDTPKPLIEVAGEPFLFHQLRLLAVHGAREIVLCVAYLGERVQRTVGVERFGLRISYSFDGPELLGTLGAIRRARPLLGERFLVLYGDTYLRIDYAALAAAWHASGLPATMSVLRNEGCWDTSNVIYTGGRVLAYDKRAPRAEMRWIDYGLSGLTPDALDLVSTDTRDLGDLFHRLAEEGLLHGYEATERFFEIGIPAALAETDAFLRSEPPVWGQRAGGSAPGEDASLRSEPPLANQRAGGAAPAASGAVPLSEGRTVV
jgi:NDP-sugar pyrophosphorylase family protein